MKDGEIAYGFAKVALLLWVPPLRRPFALLLTDVRKVRVVTKLRIL